MQKRVGHCLQLRLPEPPAAERIPRLRRFIYCHASWPIAGTRSERPAWADGSAGLAHDDRDARGTFATAGVSALAPGGGGVVYVAGTTTIVPDPSCAELCISTQAWLTSVVPVKLDGGEAH